MGQSTDGILFYGYCWEDPARLLPEREDIDPDDESHWDDEYDASVDAKARFGVEIGGHCSCDYTMPYLYISESQKTAWRGCPVQIDPNDLFAAPLDEWDKRLSDAIETYGLDISEAHPRPGWFLVSNWC